MARAYSGVHSRSVKMTMPSRGVAANYHGNVDSSAMNLVEIAIHALRSNEMFRIFRPGAGIEPLGRVEFRRASSRAVEVVQEGGAISDIDDSSGHDYPSRVAL